MKRRVLYFMMVLVLCVTLSMATPVMAGQISGTKHTIPDLPNIYYIGDTIYYETTVSNPVGNTANNTLTRIWDTLPDGTVIELLGANETLVQAPGDTDTFYTEYVVDWNDAEYSEILGYWIVSDTFQAQGYDSNGDGLYVLVTKNSQIIDPHIDVEKYVWDGAAWHDADTTTGPYLPSTQDHVIFKFDIDNDGIGDLTNVNLTDTDMSTFYTDQACNNIASFPTTLAVNETKTYYGKLDWVAGQHSNNATAVGTPPAGDPVSDSDPAHYFGSGASIDLEKYVWDGDSYEDADTTVGQPSLTSGPVLFKFTVKNDGNVALTGVNLSDTHMTNFYDNEACNISASFPTTLAVNETKTYYSSLPWVQGQHSNNATATGTPPEGGDVDDTDPAHYFGPGPSIDVEKYVWDGAAWQDADTETGPSLPSTQDPVIFKFDIDNDGNVDLTGVNLTDTDMSAFYTDQACTIPAVFPIPTLAPSDPLVTVYGKLGWAQGQHSNNATATSVPLVGDPVSDSDPANYFGSPPTPDIHIEKHTNGVDADTAPGPCISINSTVTWTYIVTNTGAVNLTGIVVTDNQPGVTPIYVSGDDGNDGILEPYSQTGEAWIYQATGVAVAGQYANIGTVVGYYGAVEVTDSDPSHYYNRPAVGWETYPVSKVRVLLPWIALFAVIVAGASLLVLRHRRMTL